MKLMSLGLAMTAALLAYVAPATADLIGTQVSGSAELDGTTENFLILRVWQQLQCKQCDDISLVDGERGSPDPLPLVAGGFSKVVQTGTLVIRAQPPVRRLILILCAAGGLSKVG